MPASPPIRWSELAGASVGVWGVGVEGRANLRKLHALGIEPAAVVDDRPAAAAGELAVPGGVLATGGGGLERLARCEVVVKSPGISRYRPDLRDLEHCGVAVVGGLGLWMEEADRATVVLVTGTKGKSTTVSVLGHLATGLGRRAFTGGNLGSVPWDPAAGADGADLLAIEASSYQVLDLWSAPRVITLTSLGEDHLDWHDGSADRYVADKLSVCTLPGAEVVIANGSDAALRKHATLLGPSVRWVGGDEAAAADWAEALGLLGSHNRTNAALAGAALVAAGVNGAQDAAQLRGAAAGFESLPSRLEPAGRIDGVEFVDDSLATNVLPTIAAVEAFAGRRVALLAGGFDRGIDYEPLAEHLRRRDEPTLVVALPDSGGRIRAALERAALPDQLEVATCDDLTAAVTLALAWCRPEGVVLLSPAAPSFGRFADYRERSAAFRAAIDSCRADDG